MFVMNAANSMNSLLSKLLQGVATSRSILSKHISVRTGDNTEQTTPNNNKVNHYIPQKQIKI
jgi:hypothetical protein